MNCRKRCLLFGFLVLVLSLGVAQAHAQTPTQQIQQTLQQVITVVASAPASGAVERRKALHEALVPRFDFFEMAKRSLGKHWNNIPDRREEFVEAFAEFLGNSYIGKISTYKDEKILFVRESMDKDLAQVDTQVVPSKGEPLSVNYRLHRVRGEWKIYDVVVEDISLVTNYRSQFNRIITRGSFEDLLRRMKEKEL
jgi:phospholipid transport system substrate-binding protein